MGIEPAPFHLRWGKGDLPDRDSIMGAPNSIPHRGLSNSAMVTWYTLIKSELIYMCSIWLGIFLQGKAENPCDWCAKFQPLGWLVPLFAFANVQDYLDIKLDCRVDAAIILHFIICHTSVLL